MSKQLTHNGETLTVAEWAEKLGISLTAMYLRINRTTNPNKLFALKNLNANKASHWRNKK